MSLIIKKEDRKQVRFEFENVVSVWNILKYLLEVPYLKRFVIEKYEGGNMLVPREAWKEEGVMFKEIRPNIYLFPYDSIGFVIDDSIHNLKMSVLDQYGEGSNFRDQAEMVYSVHNTDAAELVLNEKTASKFVSLYLLSATRLGFDTHFLEALESVIQPLMSEGVDQIEYLPASLLVGLKRISFIIRTRTGENGDSFYRITYSRHRCRRDPVKEKNLYNISYLKKKILKKNKYYPVIYYAVLAIIPVVLFFVNKKLLVALLVLYGVFRVVMLIIRRNAYKFISRNQSTARTPPGHE